MHRLTHYDYNFPHSLGTRCRNRTHAHSFGGCYVAMTYHARGNTRITLGSPDFRESLFV